MGYPVLFILSIMILGTCICQIFPEDLISIYSDDSTIIQNGATALSIISLGFVVSSLSVVASGVCEALGKGLQSLIISLIRYVIVIIPASWMFCKIWDVNGVYVAFSFTECIAAVVSVWLLKTVLRGKNSGCC